MNKLTEQAIEEIDNAMDNVAALSIYFTWIDKVDKLQTVNTHDKELFRQKVFHNSKKLKQIVDNQI